ncbi:mannosyl-glycoprotein endo-beta-N-acetylglucosamidase [Paenibacillus anaericanus]|uniref:Mannosyl-glycoprotein endo-beta-N-acetylglucosamidase n=1 Tax=Paenibacillus anaericanus TaxID=170367 RepID=A0A433YAQ9_9BACL|nr:glucosaminidase domain-containing protein [Paenibacillus anaericanus]RUT46961.1 mannosyl-glycoprotein endo-beta-N-acetylglucosamidase [Paenibacillus anaericanus]
MNSDAFIAKIAPAAVRDWHDSGVSAALTIAQGALESNWGASGLTVQANNLFGIKGSGSAGSVIMSTTEYRGGKPYKVNAAFRKYNSWDESVADHTRLLKNKRYTNVLRKGGKEAAKAVAAAGYATDPYYANKLIAMMDKYNLYSYDVKEGDEPMTAEEKKQFQALQDMVTKQADRITQLENRDNMSTPEWATEAIAAAVKFDIKNPLINTPAKGSVHFYRLITVLYRLGLFNKPKVG